MQYHVTCFKDNSALIIRFIISLGVDRVDYSRYPEEAVQKYWIRLYLEEKVRQKGDVNSCCDIIYYHVQCEIDLNCRGRPSCSNQQ